MEMDDIPANTVRVLETSVTVEPETMFRLRDNQEHFKQYQFETGVRAMAHILMEDMEVVQYTEERPATGLKASPIDPFIFRYRLSIVPPKGGVYPFHEALESARQTGMARAASLVSQHADRSRNADDYGPVQAIALDSAARAILDEMQGHAKETR